MQLRRKGLLSAVVGVAIAMLAPKSAAAFTSVEGAVIGDQNFYWNVPGQAWIFPHTIANIDNRVMFQLDAPALPASGPPNAAGAQQWFNILPIQRQRGAGFVLEIMDNLNVGMWVTEFNTLGVGTAGGTFGRFVNSAITATDWVHHPGSPVDDLTATDPFLAGGSPGDGLEAGRKVDLFGSYAMPDAGLELGGHLFWGSTQHGLKADDSTGRIDIDTDSNGTTPGGANLGEQHLDVAESKFSLSDFGLGGGVGFKSGDDVRFDAGAEINMLSVGFNPNGLSDFLNAGGFGVSLNARAHYKMSDVVTVGGFARFSRMGMGFEPLKQRDGGDLAAFNTTATPGQTASAANGPTALAPTGATGFETTPVKGIKYEESQANFQLAGLVRFEPTSRVRLYGALGYNRVNSTDKTSVGGDWFSETSATTSTLPFVNVGFEGQVFKHLDLMIGATKRWAGNTSEQHNFDTRIPNDANQNAAPPPVGSEDDTNAKRRDITTSESADTSVTQFTIGTRVHYGPVQLIGHLDPNILQRGLYLLSGSAGPTWLWVALAYDWDYDKDVNGGNGTILGGAAEETSPHKAEGATSGSEG